MSKINLILKKDPTVPLEAEVISPQSFADLTNQAIRQLPIYHGKREHKLGDYFDVEGEHSSEIELHGDLHRVRHIGRLMSDGHITIHGNVGMHLGAHMSGGRIVVHGNASDWIGGEMSGGEIHVHGDAGQQAGAAYRGSPIGMKGGTIIIDGNAGIEVGLRMRRGLIVIGGMAKDFVGLQMKGGTIVLCGGAELRTGAWMQRGTVISLTELQIMPTFARSGTFNPTFMNLYSKRLREFGVTLPYSSDVGSYTRYAGDISVPGKGEILVWNPHAPN